MTVLTFSTHRLYVDKARLNIQGTYHISVAVFETCDIDAKLMSIMLIIADI